MINLTDFFRWYNPDISEHREAVELLQRAMDPSLLQDSAEWVKRYRSHSVVDRSASFDSIRGILNQSIDWNNGNQKISRFFTVLEVTKGDIGRIPKVGSIKESNILKLAVELDKIRDEWGSPIGVTSWYRPPAVNAVVGGAINSMHLTGLAADIYTMDGRDSTFEKWLDSFWKGGLGYGVKNGLGFTHVDLGAYGRWDY